jgi:glyoxylase-like metal-dependent hydrolase (beta-lactamase superfamily II)
LLLVQILLSQNLMSWMPESTTYFSILGQTRRKRWCLKDLLPIPRTTVDRNVGDGEVMDDLDGLQVIHTPGHCAGQVAFLWPREGGVLFVGDDAANTLGNRC